MPGWRASLWAGASRPWAVSLPAAALLPVMLYTGLGRRPAVHLTLAAVFGVLWVGTFVTGVFYLPHTLPGGP